MGRVLVVVCLSCLVSAAVLVGQDEPVLFREATAAADLPPLGADAIRRRIVTIDASVLPSSPDANPSAALLLNLFDDVRLTAVSSGVTRTPTGYVWVGRIPAIERSAVTFAVAGGVVSGSVMTPDADFTVRYVADGIYAIRQVNRAALPREREPVIPDGAEVDDASPGPLADDGSIIDVLVVYTPAARTLQGGANAIEALIDLGISETNQAYATSGAIQRIRLVHKTEVTYTEAAGDIALDLSRLRNTSDGHIDVVHSLRNTHGADLVHLIVTTTDNACGIGYLMTSVSDTFASAAFGVTDESCVSPNYSFAHELGHNMGLHHDMFVTGSETGAFPYSRGYVNQAAFAPGAPSSKRWRDIMAYNDQCVASGFNCTRLLAFSSPLNTNTGDPMGNASTADAVRSLNETRVTVSNFRTAIPLSSFSVSDASVIEGNGGTTNARFMLSLSPAAGTTTSVTYTTGNGTATSGSDYIAASGTVTLPAGATSAVIDVTVNGDLQFEVPETFSLSLSNPVSATIADGVGAATIKNDDFTDQALAGLSVKTVHLDELRSLINAVRASRGMGSVTFAESLTPQVTLIRASQIAELRSALPSACMPAAYTDPTLTPGATAIKAAHIAEIRAAALACQ